MLPFPPPPFNKGLREILNWNQSLMKITIITAIVITKSVQKREGVLSTKGYSPLKKQEFLWLNTRIHPPSHLFSPRKQ